MRLLVIEDTPQITNHIQFPLPRLVSDEDVADVCYTTSLDEARCCVETFVPNTLLFDINLPDGKGFEIVEEWQGRDMQFICMSAYPREQYVDDLLATGCLAFVEKDSSLVLFREQLYAALQKALQKLLQKRSEVQDYIEALEHGRKLERRLKDTEAKLLAIKQGLPTPGFQHSDEPLERFKRALIKLPVESPNGEETIAAIIRETIVYAEADNERVHLVMQHTSELVTLPLKELEERLSPLDFVRCHKSFLVRLGAIERATANALTLSNGETVPVGRVYKETIASAINTHFGEHHPNNPFRAKRTRNAGGGIENSSFLES
jgi:DNA-binding LytR/AlgR family response regulator